MPVSISFCPTRESFPKRLFPAVLHLKPNSFGIPASLVYLVPVEEKRALPMNKFVSRLMAILMALLLLPLPGLATCGGGGGGGMGGMRGGGGTGGGDQQVYQVPWKVVDPKTPSPAGGLTLYWFPSSVD